MRGKNIILDLRSKVLRRQPYYKSYVFDELRLRKSQSGVSLTINGRPARLSDLKPGAYYEPDVQGKLIFDFLEEQNEQP